MREPSGELVELDFYFGDRSSADALRDVALHCLGSGGTYCGQLLASTFPGARAEQFQGIYFVTAMLKGPNPESMSQPQHSITQRDYPLILGRLSNDQRRWHKS